MSLRFKLQCPKCHNRMLYETQDSILTGKSKQCVYCGRHFQVKNHIVKKII